MREECCCCIPLRTGVILIGISYSLLNCLFALTSGLKPKPPGHFQDMENVLEFACVAYCLASVPFGVVMVAAASASPTRPRLIVPAAANMATVIFGNMCVVGYFTFRQDVRALYYLASLLVLGHFLHVLFDFYFDEKRKLKKSGEMNKFCASRAGTPCATPCGSGMGFLVEPTVSHKLVPGANRSPCLLSPGREKTLLSI